MTRTRRYGIILGILSIAAVAPLTAAPASQFDGRPKFAEGEGRGYYVWRDGETWHVRWTTFGAMHRFSGSVVAEGGDLGSLKRIDVETERRMHARSSVQAVGDGPE